jgi:hypothetical protein
MDEEGLTKAYSSDLNIFTRRRPDGGKTMYVSGTKISQGEIQKTWADIAVGNIESTQRYKQAAQVLRQQPEVDQIVGHSMGSVLSEHLHINNPGRFTTPGSVRLYEAPRRSWRSDPSGIIHSYAHRFDPVAVLDRGAYRNLPSSFNVHSYGGFS